MSGSFDAINSVNTALEAFQRALDVTGNNIANVNTAGYSREVVDFGSLQGTVSFGIHPYTIGNGVTIDSVNRIQDMLLNASMNSATSDMGKFQSLATALQGIQGAIPEPGTSGIASALSDFFNAWSGLSSNPGSAAAKLQVQTAAETLTQRVRNTFGSLTQQATNVQGQINNTFDQIDSLTKKIADLNTKIAAQSGGSPNQLLDQRDQAIQQLSGLIDIKTSNGPNGTVLVSTNGFSLVDTAGAKSIPRTFDSSHQSLTTANGLIPLQGGQLVGLMQAASKVAGYKSQLDALANTLRTQVNAIYATGKNAAGTTGAQFFTDSNPQTGAVDFDVTDAIKSDPANIAAGATGAAGDGSIAQALANLSTTSIAGLGTQTFSNYYSGFVSGVGNDAASAQNAVGTQGAIVQQIQNQQQAVSGVNLDEEMSNMLRFQKSYQAAAKALSVFDQVTNDLISGIQ